MVFDRHIKNSMNLCARCEQNDTEVNVDTSDHAIRIWFQVHCVYILHSRECWRELNLEDWP